MSQLAQPENDPRDNFSQSGSWWLPKTPAQKLYGELTCHPDDGLYLKATVSKRGTKHSLANRLTNFNVSYIPSIRGCLSNGKPVTLLDSHVISPSLMLGNNARIRSHIALIGLHCSNTSEPKYKKISGRLHGLSEWLQLNKFQISYPNQSSFEIKYKEPETISFQLNEHCDFSFWFGYSGPNTSSPRTSIHANCFTGFEFEYRKPQTRDTCFKDLTKLKHFLNLMTSKQTFWHDVHLSPFFKKTNSASSHTQIFANWSYPSKINWKMTNHDYLLAFSDIQKHFSTYLKNWFQKYDHFQTPIQLYFSTLESPGEYAETNFFALVRAIESLHRHEYEGRDLCEPQSVYDKRIELILNSAPDETKEWLCKKLSHSNTISLRKRVKQYFDIHEQLMADTVRSRNKFIQLVINHRNEMAHEFPRSQNAKNGIRFAMLTKKLRVLMDLCLFDIIDLPHALVHDRMRNQHSYWFYANKKWHW